MLATTSSILANALYFWVGDRRRRQANVGFPLKLLKPDNSSIATTLTDSNGEYIFNNVEPGNYSVKEESIVSRQRRRHWHKGWQYHWCRTIDESRREWWQQWLHRQIQRVDRRKCYWWGWRATLERDSRPDETRWKHRHDCDGQQRRIHLYRSVAR